MHDGDAVGRVGPYLLAERLGGGGMAVVFDAYERSGEGHMALKVLTGEEANSSRRQGRFHREVQALARLNHSAVARVYDFGAVEADDEVPEELEVPVGAPWLSMEFVEGRRLPLGPERWNWERLRSMLVQTLDALAHVHADGILHRDLKPANVMFLDEGDDVSVKLVDFGLARVLEAEEQGGFVTDHPDRTVGTPNYMAPEQVAGRRREQGPWTDLYALGCLAWRLTTGAAPFDADATFEILRKQLQEDPPRFRPQFAVPPDFENWLRRLLANAPGARTRRAADALWQLVQLEPPDATVVDVEPGDAGSEERNSVSGETVPATLTESLSVERLQRDAPDSDRPHGRPESESDTDQPRRPPIPPTGKRFDRDDREGDEPGPVLGTGLIGLRRVPFVDRESERSRLWAGLRRSARRAEPVGILLEGEEGVGKSRLASWCGRRAHELGAAIVLRAVHSPGPNGPRDGLGAMFARHYRCLGLDEDEIREFLEGSGFEIGFEGPGAAHDRAALARVMAPGSADATPTTSQVELGAERQFGLMSRVLEAMSRERPVVVWLDDVHWNPAAPRFVEHLLDADPARQLPVCVLMTVDRTAVPDRAASLSALDRLEGRDALKSLEIGRLNADDVRRLAGTSLGLDERACEEVLRRSEGNPLYVVELIRNWAEADELFESDGGYAVRAEALESAPDGLREIWVDRLHDALDAVDRQRRRPFAELLAVAALLGRSVSVREWRAARRALAAELPDVETVASRFARFGLLRSEGDAWTFGHRLARQVVRAELVDQSEESRFHRACADAIEMARTNDSAPQHRRIAEHLIEAHEWQRAVEALEQAVLRTIHGDAPAEGREIADRHEEAIEHLTGADRERHRFRNALIRSWLNLTADTALPDRTRLEDLRRRAERRGWDWEVGVAVRLLGRIYRAEGDISKAEAALSRAFEALDPEEYPVEWGRVCAASGAIQRSRGDWERAEEMLRRADEQFRRAGVETARFPVRADQIYVASTTGDIDRAREMIADARDRARAFGMRGAAATLANTAGDLERREGRFERALAEYRRARDLRQETGHEGVGTPDFNIAITHLQRGDVDRAEPCFDRLAEASGTGAFGWEPIVPLGRAAVDAHRGRRGRAERRFDRAVRRIREAGMAFLDIVRLAERFAEGAATEGDLELARRGYQLAAEQADEIGLEERRDRNRERLASLGAD